MSDLQVQAELKLKDNLSKPAGTALDSLGKNAKKAGDAVDAVGRADSVKRVARDATEAARGMDAVARGAREAQSGLRGAERGATGLARAMHGVGRGLRDAVGHLGKLKNGLNGGMQGVAAMGAAGYAIKRSTDKSVQYEKLVASMANVAYADRDAAGRMAGMKDLDASIVKAVRDGGGTREEGAATLNTLLASGAVDESTAKDKLLSVLMKASTASGASGEELSQIVVKGISQRQFSADEAELAIDKAIKAGEAGQFELKDMARWLPQIISAGKGMKGMSGFEAHLANLQAVAQVTGSNDQAGNAYFNLLGKITSTDAANNFKKAGVRLAPALAKARMEGVDPVTAFVELIEKKVVGKNKNFRTLQKKLAATSDKNERRQLMEQAAEILQGSAIGKIIQDREALLGLVGVMNGRETIKDVREQLANAHGATDTSYRVMTSTTAYQQERLANEKDIATSGFFNWIKKPLDSLLGWGADTARDNPVLASTAMGAGAVGSAYMAGSGVSSLWSWLRGGKAVPTPPAGTAVEAAAEGVGAAGGSAAAAGGKGAALLKGAAKAGSVLAVAGSAIDAVSTELDDSLTRAQKNEAHTETAGGLAGALAGGKAGAIGGAALGSFLGPIGTAIGGAIGGLGGGIAGYFGGSWVGKKLGGWFFGDDDEAAPAPQPENGAQNAPDIARTVLQAAQIMQNQPLAATLNIQLEMDGEVIARKVEQVQLRQATRR
ncbi:phage tail tape measure protein [Desulfovibrio fairfieldensis]|uniref:Phage tail tape measure protein domain-containing protein n=1 Tax=Desulfovibrio fairfieldensis TaxID=44742 RepID=A0A109W4E3_9BACT|nr:phage tail tape measure protein [Desulfovibrio fairfieldensis]AMD90301.1 hypothetical protein AXF13_09290 [Desulfovibrio fairfieldensis]